MNLQHQNYPDKQPIHGVMKLLERMALLKSFGRIQTLSMELILLLYYSMDMAPKMADMYKGEII